MVCVFKHVKNSFFYTLNIRRQSDQKCLLKTLLKT